MLRVPANFSLIDNAEGAVEFLMRAAALAYSREVQSIIISHENCTRVGLGAEGMLATMAMIMNNRGKKLSGIVPADEAMKRLIWAIGTPKILGVSKFGHKEIQSGEIKVLRYRSTQLEGLQDVRTADPKGKAIAKILAYIDGCLQGHGTSLSPDGTDILLRFLGEIIGNAEEHAGLVDWTVLGYLDNAEDGIHVCEISIFNFGRTIAETFLKLDPNDPMLRDMLKYVDLHQKKGFFNSGWSPEDLITLLALQAHVSCKRSIDQTRGNGTVEAISVFQDIANSSCTGKTAPKVQMSIYSGSTQILLDGTYGMTEDSTGRKIIPLNEKNTLLERPDPKYVKHLDNLYLPATIISIRFPLLPEHLRSKEQSNVEHTHN